MDESTLNSYYIKYTSEGKMYVYNVQHSTMIDCLEGLARWCRGQGHTDIMLIEIRSFVRSRIIPSMEVVSGDPQKEAKSYADREL
jgi:hypothetical protein